jgi:hypothetical protein
MFTTPILFLIFNRPITTKLVFEKIRQQKPSVLFVASDGPREAKFGEAAVCEECRNIVLNGIDWPCEVKTLFREKNLGCGTAVSQAITWFFKNVEEGIVLEDDCLPDSSFFSYCALLLDRYRQDQRVFLISGNNLIGTAWKSDLHSYFWGHIGVWGWASWRRAWNLYDYRMNGWEKAEMKSRIRDALKTEGWFGYYYSMYESAYKGTLDTWDVQWCYTILKNGGLSANPSVNLVKNLGFGNQSTHTNNQCHPFANLSVGTLDFPLIHPPHFITDVDYLGKMLLEAIPNKKKEGAYLRITALIKKISNGFVIVGHE